MGNQDQNIQRTLGRIEGSINGIDNRLERMEGNSTKQDVKINALESAKDKQSGIMIALSFVGGAVANLALKLFK